MTKSTKKAKVLILMGSDSDLEVMSESAKILEEFNVPYSITVASAHRSPVLAAQLALKEYKKGIKVFIAGAGGSAHLAGVMASFSVVPVIGVPVKAKAMEGLDSLLSTVNMPPGVPVATVGIDAAKNAGLLAIQILATSDKKLEKKLLTYKKKLSDKTKKKGEKLQKLGYKKYLSEK